MTGWPSYEHVTPLLHQFVRASGERRSIRTTWLMAAIPAGGVVGSCQSHFGVFFLLVGPKQLDAEVVGPCLMTSMQQSTPIWQWIINRCFQLAHVYRKEIALAIQILKSVSLDVSCNSGSFIKPVACCLLMCYFDKSLLQGLAWRKTVTVTHNWCSAFTCYWKKN
jgi:hypothetical protein